jgi:hypothetical protein
MHGSPLDTVTFYDNALKKELLLVPVQHSHSSRLTEGWIQHELHRVHHMLSFVAVAFLGPVFYCHLATPYWLSRFYSKSVINFRSDVGLITHQCNYGAELILEMQIKYQLELLGPLISLEYTNHTFLGGTATYFRERDIR